MKKQVFNEDFGIADAAGAAGKIVAAPFVAGYKLIKGAAQTDTGTAAILYAGKKYMQYKKNEDPVKFINETIKLSKILITINNAVKHKESQDPQSLEMNLSDEDWVVGFKQRLLTTLRQNKNKIENQHRADLVKYTEFLVNKKACYLCKSPDQSKPGDLYYSQYSKMLFLVTPDKIEFFMVYKNFPEKIFWLKENIRIAQEEFNKKQIKMYGANAKDWNGKPIKKAEIKRVEEEMRNPGTTGGKNVETPKE